MKKVPAFELRSVSYVAAGRKILHSINWTVEQGEHWAILGPNGSGKTTLLRLACGYLWPNAGGEVYRKGKILIHLPELRKSIGWVTSTLPAEIPSRERVLRTVVSGKFAQIGYVEGFGGEATRQDYRLAERYLAQMRSGTLRDQEFGVLSQGEQQKVLIARARMTKPYLIILDEPCAGMDPGARENFLATLQSVGETKSVAQCAANTSRPMKGSLIAGFEKSMPKLKPSRFSSRPSSRAKVSPSRPSIDN